MAPTEAPRGLPGALDDEVEELRPLVRAVASAILREGRMHPDVEDCTNETMKRALEGRDRLRPGEPLRPWLLGIARHVALDALRARARSRARLVRPFADGDDPLDRVPDSAPAVDERLERARRATAIRRVLEDLPADQKRALELFHLEGLAYREIAARLGVPLGTVCTWISRGRRAIADAMGDEGGNA